MRTVNEVAGRDLQWFWDQAVYGTQVLDYEVLARRLQTYELVRGKCDREKR